jgi:hypothetical protein
LFISNPAYEATLAKSSTGMSFASATFCIAAPAKSKPASSVSPPNFRASAPTDLIVLPINEFLGT